MKFGVVLLIVALMLVGLVSFGSVNQFEVETGLTVEALMLPIEKTVETAEGIFVNRSAYTEIAVAQYHFDPDIVTTHAPYDLIGASMANIKWADNYGIWLADRLKYPLCSGPMRVV